MREYDFVLAGGGAAGLSLAYRLARDLPGEHSILIVDRDARDRNDRTWCFWTDRPTPFDGIVHRSWDRLQVVAEGLQRTLPLGRYRYRMIRGIDFYRFVQQGLSACPRVDFLRGNIERIEDGPDGASVWVDGREHRGRWVFDSRFHLPRIEPAPSRYVRLLQQFKGWEIETPGASFDPLVPTFLDFRTPQRGAVRFLYLLPLSERRALVEYVVCAAGHLRQSHNETRRVFGQRSYARASDTPRPCGFHPGLTLAPGEADESLDSYVRSILGVEEYRIVGREGGASLMTDQPLPRRIGRSILAIGARGGRVKPSTGYAFWRIQQDSAAIVRSLSRVGHPFQLPPDSRRYRLYDSLMLQIMHRRPERVGQIFAILFERNPTERVLRFLDEVGSPWENLLLIATLPDPLFLRALARSMVPRE